MIPIPTDSLILHPEQPMLPKRLLLRELPTPGDFLLVLDNSSLEKFSTCDRSAQYHLVYSREAHAKNAALVFGGAVHEGLEALYRGESIDVQNQRIVQFFANNPAPLDDFRTVGNALEVLKFYRYEREHNPEYADETLTEYQQESCSEVPILERAFELPLGVIEIDQHLVLPQWDGPRFVRTIHVAWSGRIDRLMRFNSLSHIQDHKTGIVIESEEYYLASQTTGYVWAGRQLWPELDIWRFCLNALRLKKPTGSGAINLPGPRGGDPALKLFRAYFTYSAEDLLQWEQNTMALVSDFVHNLVRDYHPMKTKWCFGKFGKCPYHTVCTFSDAESRLRYLHSEAFKDVTWDPVAGR